MCVLMFMFLLLIIFRATPIPSKPRKPLEFACFQASDAMRRTRHQGSRNIEFWTVNRAVHTDPMGSAQKEPKSGGVDCNG